MREPVKEGRDELRYYFLKTSRREIFKKGGEIDRGIAQDVVSDSNNSKFVRRRDQKINNT